MTIPRVLLAAALLTLGFMIWGVHKDIGAFRRDAGIVGAEVLAKMTGTTSQLTSANDKLDAAHAKLDKLKPTGVIRVGKPRVRSVPHMPPHPLTLMERLFGPLPAVTASNQS